LLTVSDRESSILSATRSMQESIRLDKPMSVFQPFYKLEGIEVQNHNIVASPTEYARDIIELVHDNNLNILFYPWRSLDDKAEASANGVISVLFQGCPSTVCLFISSSSLFHGSGHGKIYIPFFGGPHDREAVRIGLSFSSQSTIVIARFISTSSTSSEEKDPLELHNEHFTSVEDSDLMDAVSKLSNENISVKNRKYKSPSDAFEGFHDELASNYSLVILGRNMLDGFPIENDRTHVLGTLATEILANDIPSSLLIVNKSKRSPRYANELPEVLDECS